MADMMPTSYLDEKLGSLADAHEWLIGYEGNGFVDTQNRQVVWILENAKAIVAEIEKWQNEWNNGGRS